MESSFIQRAESASRHGRSVRYRPFALTSDLANDKIFAILYIIINCKSDIWAPNSITSKMHYVSRPAEVTSFEKTYYVNRTLPAEIKKLRRQQPLLVLTDSL